MSESRVRENRTHGSMRRREATTDQSASPCDPRNPPADPTLRHSRPHFRFRRYGGATRWPRVGVAVKVAIRVVRYLGELTIESRQRDRESD